MNNTPWINSDPDTYQYVHDLGNDVFELVEVRESPGALPYSVAVGTVNVKEIMENDPEDFCKILNSFGYDGIGHLHELYGDAAMQIAAECIFESDEYVDRLGYSSEKEAIAAINEIVGTKDVDNDTNVYALIQCDNCDLSVNTSVSYHIGLKAAKEAMNKSFEMSRFAWNVPEAGEEDEDHYIRRNDMSITIHDGCEEIRWEISKVNVEE